MRRARLFIPVVLLPLLAAGLWAWSRPFDARELWFLAQVRLGGARPVRVHGLKGYVRDTCREGGECRCAALVHGLGDTALTWRRILRDERDGRVPSGWRVYAFNLPGTRGSAPPPTPAGYALKEQARALADSLEGLCGGREWTVVGNSLGGWIAAWLAIERPDLVGRLILVDAAGVSDPTGRTERTGRVLAYPTPDSMREFAQSAAHRPYMLSDRLWKELARRVAKKDNARVLATITADDLLDEALASLSVPTEILWGLSDGVIPVDVGLRFAELITGSSFRAVQGCGHLPQAECPTTLRWLIFGRQALTAPAFKG